MTLRLLTFLAVLTLPLQGPALAGNWMHIPERDVQAATSTEQGVISIQTTGSDPYLIGELAEIRSDEHILEFDYLLESDIDRIQLYVGPPISETATCDLPGISSGRHNVWQTYIAEITGSAADALEKKPKLMRLDFGSRAGAKIQIRNLRLRRQTEAEIKRNMLREQIKKLKADEAARIGGYLKESFPLSIDSVKVAGDHIILRGGSLPPSFKLVDLSLVEYPAWHSIGDVGAGIPLEVALEPDGDRWQAVVPRRNTNQDTSRDRLHSGWRLRQKKGNDPRFVSARKFATEIVPLTNHFPDEPLRPANQKGMGGVTRDLPLDELLELGVTAITVNLRMDSLVTDRGAPFQELLKTPVGTFYLNPRGFHAYDSIVRWANQNDVIVRAILLIGVSKNGDRSPLVHLDNEAGPYSMPNLASERGAILYERVLDAIVRRYNNSPDSPGPINDWIAHNEIDHHHVWTNMGRQPPEIVTETYYRSMRMIQNAARQYNPHARVFASTTHFWHVPNAEPFTRLAPRGLYLTLQRYSLTEGEFPWGVGHHPYPYDLRAAYAWTDTLAEDGPETLLISMQNIDVLKRFLQNESMLDSQGKPRSVVLSEQGYDSRSYSDPDQANQAGSLAFAMQKVRAMPMIESFHYHRWIDHPDEAGSLFGLRTLPTPGAPFGKKKRSWEVYRAIGTSRENEVVRDLPTP